MSSAKRDALEKRAQRAILQNAVFRPESAIVIALTLLLAFFMPLVISVPAFVWLLGGLIAEALLVYSSLTDEEANRKVVARMLQDAFRPEELTSPELQRAVDEALDYRSRVAAAVREQRDSVLKDELLQTAQQFDEWLEEIYGLAQRLDRYNKDRHIHDRNRKRAEERVRQLEKQLQREASPAVRQEIDSNLAAIRRQLEAITQLDDAMARAALRLENTVTAMGTIYTQVTLMGAKDIDSGRSRRLRLEISEEVTELSDVLAAMDEVYATEGAS